MTILFVKEIAVYHVDGHDGDYDNNQEHLSNYSKILMFFMFLCVFVILVDVILRSDMFQNEEVNNVTNLVYYVSSH